MTTIHRPMPLPPLQTLAIDHHEAMEDIEAEADEPDKVVAVEVQAEAELKSRRPYAGIAARKATRYQIATLRRMQKRSADSLSLLKEARRTMLRPIQPWPHIPRLLRGITGMPAQR